MGLWPSSTVAACGTTLHETELTSWARARRLPDPSDFLPLMTSRLQRRTRLLKFSFEEYEVLLTLLDIHSSGCRAAGFCMQSTRPQWVFLPMLCLTAAGWLCDGSDQPSGASIMDLGLDTHKPQNSQGRLWLVIKSCTCLQTHCTTPYRPRVPPFIEALSCRLYIL